MNIKIYFETIGKKLDFITRNLRYFGFLIFIGYLFYLTLLAVDISSAIEYVPSVEEVQKKSFSIISKKEVINSIERYFSAKQENLSRNLSKPAERNPFMPYDEAVPEVSGGAGNNPVNNVIN